MKREPKITQNEWQAELCKLPVYKAGMRAQEFTERQDEQILWANKNKVTFAAFLEWFKKKHGFGSVSIIRRRIRVLKGKSKS